MNVPFIRPAAPPPGRLPRRVPGQTLGIVRTPSPPVTPGHVGVDKPHAGQGRMCVACGASGRERALKVDLDSVPGEALWLCANVRQCVHTFMRETS